MSTTLPALEAMRAVFLAANPNPETDSIVGKVHIYPNEEREIHSSPFPFVVIREVLNNVNSFNKISHGTHIKVWIMEASVFIRLGNVETANLARDFDEKHAPWPSAVLEVIEQQPNLFGNVFKIGQGQTRFQWITGAVNYGVNNPKTFWGIQFRFPITQVGR